METSYEYIQRKIQDTKQQYPDLRALKDDQVFIHLCIKYFFYDIEENFDVSESLDSVVDGAGDGGIDAVFADPNDENNDVFIIQSKFYSAGGISRELILNAISKIKRCISDVKNHKYSNYKDDVVNRLVSAFNDKDKGCNMRVLFITPYDPRTEKSIRSIEKAVSQEFPELNVEIKFGKDICKQIDNQDKSRTCIEHGSVQIDRRDNSLRYGDDAVIVNVSAQSLADLYHMHGNALLGLNLRYYIRNKNVDNAIEKTINEKPDEFWYRNNGITLICDNFKIDGKSVHLDNFSIINGGQTTYRISKADIEDDFYLLCKIVKRRGTTDNEKDDFVVNISQATNAQKPIKLSDLMSNTPEQIRLKRELCKLGVCYITKRGEKSDKKRFHPYQITTIQKFGKISLATLLQQPGKARNNQTAIFKEEVYPRIFRNPNTKLVNDLLRVDYYYSLYKKAIAKEKLPKRVKGIVANGNTYHLAAVTFLCMLHSGKLSLDEVYDLEDKPEEIIKGVYKASHGDYQLIQNKLTETDECEIFCNLFKIISQNVIREAFDSAQDRDKDKDLQVSNFYKLERTYVDLIVKRLVNAYTAYSGEIKGALDVIMGKANM